jgi:hypothetical protein
MEQNKKKLNRTVLYQAPLKMKEAVKTFQDSEILNVSVNIRNLDNLMFFKLNLI